jgi:hypothetical protein
MSKRRVRAALAAVLGTAAATCAAQATLDPEQFVVGWSLEVPVPGFFDIPLSLDVYAHMPSIEQLAVLDSNGAPMPFYRLGSPAREAGERRDILDASPLYAVQAGDARAELSIATGERRASVAVTQPAQSPESEVVAFIVDARGVDAGPFAIDFEWRAAPQPFLIDVRIEHSSTLTDWRPVGRASVAALSIGGAEVRHGRVPVVAAAGGYYRVTWNRAVTDWYVERATLVSSAAARAPLELTRLRPLAPTVAPPVARSATEEVSNALYFDAGGALPVAAVTLEWNGAGGWTGADVAASDSLEGPWSTVGYRTLFYALVFAGERLANPPLVVGRREARYGRIVPSAVVDRERVELRLDYPQEFLRVSAVGGSPPFLLAAGTLAAAAGPDPTFSSVWAQLKAPADAGLPQAVLGTRRELGGLAALVAPFAFPWRVAALWAVLGGGVLAVAWMAVRLAREMRSTQT